MKGEADLSGIRFQIWLGTSAILLLLVVLRLATDPNETEDRVGLAVARTPLATADQNVRPRQKIPIETSQNASHDYTWASLLQRLSDPDAKIRRSALADLQKLNLDAGHSVPVLMACLHDPDPEVRASAATQLGAYRLAAADAVPQLKQLAFNHAEDDAVRSRAKDALYNIRFYDFGRDDQMGTPVP